MCGRYFFGTAVVVAAVAGLTQRAPAQQVKIGSPFMTISDKFYENFQVGLQPMGRMGSGGGWFFAPGTNATPPQFGGYDPGADARFGFNIRAGGQNFGLTLTAGQGTDRSLVLEEPTIVIPNGGTGSLFSGSMRPFVTGVVPVVGTAPPGMGWPMMGGQSSVSPLRQKLEQLREEEDKSRAEAIRDEQREAQAAARDDAAPQRDDAPLVLKGGKSPAAGKSAGAAATPARSRSSANHGDVSLAEIRRQQATADAARAEEIETLVEKARGHEEAGKPGLAKIYYQQAALRATGQTRQDLVAKIRSLPK